MSTSKIYKQRARHSILIGLGIALRHGHAKDFIFVDFLGVCCTYHHDTICAAILQSAVSSIEPLFKVTQCPKQRITAAVHLLRLVVLVLNFLAAG
jgi:hypothetical protein